MPARPADLHGPQRDTEGAARPGHGAPDGRHGRCLRTRRPRDPGRPDGHRRARLAGIPGSPVHLQPALTGTDPGPPPGSAAGAREPITHPFHIKKPVRRPSSTLLGMATCLPRLRGSSYPHAGMTPQEIAAIRPRLMAFAGEMLGGLA